MKTYFIFQVQYSQTDRGMAIVEATSVEEAEAWLRRHGDDGPRYVNFYGESSIIKANGIE